MSIESQLSNAQCRFQFKTLSGAGTFYIDQLELRRIEE